MKIHFATGHGQKMKAIGIFSTNTRCGRNDAQQLLLTTADPALVTCRHCLRGLADDAAMQRLQEFLAEHAATCQAGAD
jgi:hypothetical protein